ncbi:MAG: DUF3943 domain-containing protein [Myxococcota bacterium]
MRATARVLSAALCLLGAATWAALPDDAPRASDDAAAERPPARAPAADGLATPDAPVANATPADAAVEPAPALTPRDLKLDSPGLPEPGHATFENRPVRTDYLIPALESEALHLGFLAFSNLVTRQSFALVSFDSIKSHFDGRRPWTFDVDYFITNQFGHPYQGALAFTAARSAGVPFWLACLYPLLASMTWELFYEVDAPSVNDQITTTFGGIFLGEVLHRAALLVLTDTAGRAPSWGRKVGAFLLSPMGTVNRWMSNDELWAGDVDDHPPYFAQLAAGANLGAALRDPVTRRPYMTANAQLNLQGRLTYGIPGDPDFRYRHPFSHFDLDFNLSLGGGEGASSGSYFSRGLLLGTHFGNVRTAVRGLWGLFGQYDYSGASLVRVSTVGVGIGASLQARLSENNFLQATGLFGGVPFATAGSLGLDEELYRDYHIGPGAQAALELRLINRNVGWLRIVARNWFVVGAYTPPSGWESITYLTIGPMVRLLGPVGLGADVVLALRRSEFQDHTFDRSVTGYTARVTLAWLSDWNFGVVDPAPGPLAVPSRDHR